MDKLFELIGLALPDTATMLRLKVLVAGGLGGLGAGMLFIASGVDGAIVWGALMAGCGIVLIVMPIRSLLREVRLNEAEHSRSQQPAEAEVRQPVECLARPASCEREVRIGGLSGSIHLEVLVSSMSVGQRLRFKQAVVRQAIHSVTRTLPPEAADEGHRGGVLAATHWLSCPTEEIAKEVTLFAAGECWDGGVRYYDYPGYFLAPAWAAGATDPCEAARHAAAAVPEAEREAASRWQIAAASAVLRGEEPPSLE